MVTQSLYRNLQETPVRPDGQLPKNLRELIEAGGVEALVQAAGERAMLREREFWLPALERYKLPEDADIFDQLTLQIYIAGLGRKLGIKPDADTIGAQTRERVRKHQQRTRALAHTGISSRFREAEGRGISRKFRRRRVGLADLMNDPGRCRRPTARWVPRLPMCFGRPVSIYRGRPYSLIPISRAWHLSTRGGFSPSRVHLHSPVCMRRSRLYPSNWRAHARPSGS
jgi:hypothetical protein